ncbi:hypothetical protein KR018_006429 [Drosophila ironensis]|nr:hypothetical protein KR018_006429 [Drosophila ironensis]
MKDICRTCSGQSDSGLALDLFDPSGSFVLGKIQEVTGLQLSDAPELPRLICLQCQQALQTAIDFRRACIEAQKLWQSPPFVSLEQLDQWLEVAGHGPPMELLSATDIEAPPGEPAEQTEEELLQELSDLYAAQEAEEPVDFVPAVAEVAEEAENAVIDEEVAEEAETEGIEEEVAEEADSADILCSTCGLGFDNLEELQTHKYQLHDVPLSTKFVCDHCGEGFRSAAGLTQHCTSISLPLNYQCSKCSIKLHTEILLTTHEERCQAPPNGRAVCHICGKQLASVSNLKNHLVRHAGTRPHKCNICKAAFAVAGELAAHVKVHSSERPFACRHDCGKAFRYSSARSIHERVHMDASKRHYRCEYCPKAFVTPSDCKAHQKHHTQARIHSCETCRISFKELKHLRVHLKSNTHKTLEARANAVKRGISQAQPRKFFYHPQF